MRAVLASVAVVALLATGCSSLSNGIATVAGTAVGSSPPLSSSAAVPDLSSQLLTLAEFSGGWSFEDFSGVESTDSDEPSCFKNADSAFEARPSVERDFTQGSDFPEVDQSIGWYGSSTEAQSAFATGVAGLNVCRNFSYPEEGTSVAGTLVPLSFPALGDRSRAWRATVSATAGGTSDVIIDLVVVNRGDEIEVLSYADWVRVDVDQFTELVDDAVARMP